MLDAQRKAVTFEIFLVGFVSIGIALWAKLEERRERRQVEARIKTPPRR